MTNSVFSLNLLHPNISIYILHTLLYYILFWYWQGEFIWRSKLLILVIISFILMILRNDSAVLLKGEIRYWSLLGYKGLIKEFAVFLITYYLFIYLFILYIVCIYV